MIWVRVLAARIRGLVARRTRDAALDEEIATHLQLLADDYVRQGLTPEEARRAARRTFGGVQHTKEAYRDQRGLPWLTDAGRDLRHGLRVLRRSPGFAAGVILTLALGIGMATAVFTVLDAVVLRPLPLPHAERLVWIATAGGLGEPKFVHAPDFIQWREQATTFDRLIAYGTGDQTLDAPGGAVRVRVATITADYWDLSGVRPAIGRLPLPGEPSAIVLSHDTALRYFGGLTDILGRAVNLDGLPATVVGVLAAGSSFYLPTDGFFDLRPGSTIDVFQPLSIEEGELIQLLSVAGRMKAGVTIEQARTELSELHKRIAATQPNMPPNVGGDRRLIVLPLQEQLAGSARASLLLLMGAGASVLLIAWANATNLLLLRAASRWREIAIRASIGASRGRVLRQLIVETVVLASAAASLGVLFARLGVSFVVSAFSAAVPRLAEAVIDSRVLAVVAAMTVITALVCSVAPALGYRHIAPGEVLQATAPTTSRSKSGASTRNLLVTLEVALTFVLLLGGGLMLKSLARMHEYPPGFEPDRVLSMRVQFSGAEYRSSVRQTSFAAAFLSGLHGRPGVAAVSLSTHGNLITGALEVEGRRRMFQSHAAPIYINATTSEFNRVMGARLIRGRWLRDEEDAAVINASLARREFPHVDPIGHRVRVEPREPWLTIVGVVGDLKYSKLDAGPDPELFVPYTRAADSLLEFTALVKATGDPMALAPQMRQAMSRADPSQVADHLMTLESALGETIAPRTLDLLLLTIFAATSLLLAVAGIYGVIAYSIAQRTHEIGIRLALGASHRVVTGMIVRQGLRTIAAGVVAGLVVALAVGRFMTVLLYDVRPTDAQTYAAVTIVLTGAALLSCYAPAIAIARIAPTVALRHE